MRTGIGNVYIPRQNILYAHSYLGLNITRNGYDSWGVGTDGNLNGGSLLVGGMGGDMLFVTVPTANPTMQRFLSDENIRDNTRMVLNSTGQLRIGRSPASHPNYKLAVDGELVTRYIYVTQPNDWADFVFAPDYRLLPLPELAAYLRLNQHLPTLPSAAEVTANGYSVTDMDARLLQTIEELTLRLIELDKQLKALQAQVAAQGSAQPAPTNR